MADVKKCQTKKIVKCPHCGWEYLPAEVLYVENVLGMPTNSIVRDPLGHILYEEYREGDEPHTEEKYICDNCGKPFIIVTDISYTTKPQEEILDFSDTSIQLW